MQERHVKTPNLQITENLSHFTLIIKLTTELSTDKINDYTFATVKELGFISYIPRSKPFEFHAVPPSTYKNISTTTKHLKSHILYEKLMCRKHIDGIVNSSISIVAFLKGVSR